MNLNQLFLEKLRELSSAEKLLIAGLPSLVKAASNTKLRAAFSNHLKQTQTQVLRVSNAQKSLRIAPASIPCRPIATLLSDAAKAAKRKPTGPVRDLAILGAAERIEHFEIAAYLSAISLAKTLNYGDAANLLIQNLMEEQKAAELLKKISDTLLEQAQNEASR